MTCYIHSIRTYAAFHLYGGTYIALVAGFSLHFHRGE